MYTQTETVLGTRIDGNGGGKFLIAGPNWKGEVPDGIKRIVNMDTEFAYVHYRTQVFDAGDAPNVVAIQDKLSVQGLNEIQGISSEDTFSQLTWLPISKESEKGPANYFNYLNLQLAFMPAYPEEVELRNSFKEIGIIPGEPFSFDNMDADKIEAIKEGFQEGIEAITNKYKTTNESKTLFGSHDDLGTDYLSRAAGQMVGLYGLPKEESVYASNTIAKDTGQSFDTSKDKYILRFEKDKLPPADAFWSVTMYDGVKLLFVDNPINRYLINSPMVNDLKFDDDGGLTLYIQKDNPGKAKESNWLPAPDGTFFLITRIYMPRESVLNNEWTAPQVELNNL
jgi:hypothetical protein